MLDRLLQETGLQIDGLSGSSAGAVNAVVVADGPGRPRTSTRSPSRVPICAHSRKRCTQWSRTSHPEKCCRAGVCQRLLQYVAGRGPGRMEPGRRLGLHQRPRQADGRRWRCGRR
ncbi:hypothetical protein IFU01_01845 [Oxalobacteraceae sp. CFBP 8763]|nr:hypothetical protein [Oxalobacteraceae sp. CFBP 8763]